MNLNFLKLGIVYEQVEGKWRVRNHRSLFKVVFNPFLRLLFGIQLGTVFEDIDTDNPRIKGYEVLPSPRIRTFKVAWFYGSDDPSFRYRVEFKRWLI